MVTLAILFSLFLVHIFNFWNNMVIHLGLASDGVSIGGPSHSTVIGGVASERADCKPINSVIVNPWV